MANNDTQAKTLGRFNPVLGSTQVPTASDYAKFQNIATMDTYLLTQGYTQATLNLMTKNDKVYAIRQKLGDETKALP